MGHKVNPIGIRLGISKDWNSKWYANKREFATNLVADLKVRELLKQRLAQAGVSRIQIERPAKNARITIFSARPGVVIGKKGEDIENLRGDLRRMMGGEVGLNIEEIRKPEVDAQLVGDFRGQLGVRAAREEHQPLVVSEERERGDRIGARHGTHDVRKSRGRPGRHDCRRSA